jgi:hypothetical protein
MTAVSDARSQRSTLFSHFVLMARGSLVLWGTMAALAVLGTGCLVTDNPQVQAPPLRGPFLNSFNPSTFRILSVRRPLASSVIVPMSFEVWSDDGGSSPRVFFQRDFEVASTEDRIARKGKNLAIIEGIGLGEFDQPRSISTLITIGAEVGVGCHSITAVVTYNFDTVEWLPVPGSRWESATWWIDVGDIGETGANVISTCPEIGVVVDAGDDGAPVDARGGS